MDILATVAVARNAAGGGTQPKEGLANDNAANDNAAARTNAGHGRGNRANGAPVPTTPIDGALLATMDPNEKDERPKGAARMQQKMNGKLGQQSNGSKRR